MSNYLGIELFFKERFNLLYRAWYALWVYWWPIWRMTISGPRIVRKWHQFSLIKRGQKILDFGCGTGYFTIQAAKVVGDGGFVYALDCFPRQLQIVKRRTSKNNLFNVTTILSDGDTDLPDESVDVIWMCDVFHEIKNKDYILKELHRILNKVGLLVIYDGMKERLLDFITDQFTLKRQAGKLFVLSKS